MPSGAREARLPILVAFAIGILGLIPSLAHADFGISSFVTTVSTTQAGAHADVTTSFALNADALGNPIGQIRSAKITLPRGLIGSPDAIERCSVSNFESFSCGRASQVGVIGLALLQCEGVSAPLLADAEAGATTLSVENADSFCDETKGGSTSDTITIGSGSSTEEAQIARIVNNTTLELQGPLAHHHDAAEEATHTATATTVTIPLFNIQPSPGHIATFAASLLLADVFVQVGVNPDGRLTATISETSTIFPIQAANVTLWGVPAAPDHNAQRCSELIVSECGASPMPAAGFMTNPTQCATPLDATLDVSSWGGHAGTATTSFPTMTGCEALAIDPSLSVAPTTTQADTPAGYEVGIRVPQDEQPYGVATPALQDLSVTLPAGASLSPGLANGLVPCTDTNLAEGHCPSASRIGNAEIDTPLLEEHLTGGIYVATPTAAEKYRVFVIIRAESATISLRGRAEANEATGQVTAVFNDLPPVPFSSLRLNFYGGSTAAFANPVKCGSATSTSHVASYGGQTATSSSTFIVSADGEGACPPNLPFQPTFAAGSSSPLAGDLTPFTLAVSRNDGQQQLSSLTAQLPPGLLAALSQVPPCGEEQASIGQCPAQSRVGTAALAAGPGALPLHLSGSIYLTGPYKGAPFGLSIAVPATAGPFNFGTIVVRTQILVSPSDMHLTIAADPLPQVVAGVPLRLRYVNLTIDRPGFILNPTGCAPQRIEAAITSVESTITTATVPFGVAGCSQLNFQPHLAVFTHAGGKRRGSGASFAVQITTPARPQANVSSVIVGLPAQLRPRLTTIQDACPSKTFAVDPTLCPRGALIGTATARTPLLSSALGGSIFLVASSANALPELTVLLSGQGITLTLHGGISISKSGTITAAFRQMPDVPISLFRLELPSGPHSLLGAITNVCARSLTARYTIIGQNQDHVTGRSRVVVGGCPKRHKNLERHRRVRSR